MTKLLYRGVSKPRHTAEEVAGWYKLMRENQWSSTKLAKHLGKSYTTVITYLEKYNAGLLK